MDGFTLKIVTPDGNKYSGQAESLIVRTSEGDICILKNHADFVGTVDVSAVKIKTADGERHAACSAGFITVSKNDVDFIATTFEFSDEIDVVRAEAAKQRAEAIIANKNTDQNIAVAEMKLKRALIRLQVAKYK